MGSRILSFPIAKSAGLRLLNTRFGSPYHVIIETTTKCNLNCRTCMRSKQESGIFNSEMSFDLYESLIKDLKYPTRFVSFVGISCFSSFIVPPPWLGRSARAGLAIRVR